MEPGSFSVDSLLLAARTIWQPFCAHPRASARPIPRLAPRMMATLSASEDMKCSYRRIRECCLHGCANCYCRIAHVDLRFDLVIFPEPEAAQKSVHVVAEPAARRQALELLGIAAPNDDAVGHQGSLQTGDDVLDCRLPLLLAQPFQPAQPDEILEGLVFLVRQVRELQRCDHILDDESAAHTGAQPDKEHAPALVAAKCLHGGIVDELYRFAKLGLEIKINPARPEVFRLQHRLAVNYRAGVADGDNVVLPVLCLVG